MIAISQFSGKCDCYDHFSEYTDEQLQKSQIFIGDQIVPLRINNQHDLAPYYAHIVGSVGYCDGIAVCRLTEKSYVDSAEEDFAGVVTRFFDVEAFSFADDDLLEALFVSVFPVEAFSEDFSRLSFLSVFAIEEVLFVVVELLLDI